MRFILLILICFSLSFPSSGQVGKSPTKYVKIGGKKGIVANDSKVDVDHDIPKNRKKFEKRLALVIGNESYSMFLSKGNEIDVDYAMNDANTFAQYCTNLLGVKEENLTLLTNATSARMRQAIKRIAEMSKLLGDGCEIILYYAGHGLPDEQFKASYLIPVDVDASNLESAIKLSDLYRQLSANSTSKVTVFLDACFTGGARGDGLIASRGIVHTVKDNYLGSNMVVFSASSGDQSALPWKEKKHGIFTYYLLEKIKASKGQVSYKDLYDHVKKNVELNSWRINNKAQSPKILVSPSVKLSWAKFKLI